MGWIIFGGILLFLFALLMAPVHITAEWDEKLTVNIKYLFIRKTLFPFEKKEEKTEEKEEQKPKPKAAAKPKKQRKKPTLEGIIDGIIDAVNRYGPGAKMILKNIRFHRLELFWKIAAEDAAACAIRYGKICAYLSSALGFFRNLMKIERTNLRVYPDFTAEKEEIRGGADIEFNPLIVMIGALRIGIAFIKDFIAKAKKQKRKPKKRINKAKRSAQK